MKYILIPCIIFSSYAMANDDSNVILYQDSKYQGKSLVITDSVPFLKDFNDVLSSIKIPEGKSVTLYADANFVGDLGTFDKDIPWVGTELNDKVSSIMVETLNPNTNVCVGTGLSAHAKEAMRRALDGRYLGANEVIKEVEDSDAYDYFNIFNGNPGWGTYGITITYKLKDLPDGSEPVGVTFYEYGVKSGFPTPSTIPVNFNGQDVEYSAGVSHKLSANMANSVGDTIQIIGQVTYSDGSQKQIRTKTIVLKP
ncbi:hypothetical protein [Photobacterium damselae]|uniref:hypothetical protein n=1 Tax=Photobacterium damselae TaxID=38293 RepID=UPI001F477C91|nr:hypothetical protein [Photobacterium damselae]UKA11698.1 hypothetical protein IHC91_18115 [Photobacterium damselae subsp. damselae]